MFATYRLGYLSVAVALMGGIALVAASSEPADTGPGARSIRESKDKLFKVPAVALPGTEQGNLSEVGAKELFARRDFDQALRLSQERPVLLFKHSTECDVSGGAYRRLSVWLKDKPATAPAVYTVKVIERKLLSQQIASRLDVKHESPQAILLFKGKTIWTADHEGITAEAVQKALASIPAEPKKG